MFSSVSVLWHFILRSSHQWLKASLTLTLLFFSSQPPLSASSSAFLLLSRLWKPVWLWHYFCPSLLLSLSLFFFSLSTSSSKSTPLSWCLLVSTGFQSALDIKHLLLMLLWLGVKANTPLCSVQSACFTASQLATTVIAVTDYFWKLHKL